MREWRTACVWGQGHIPRTRHGGNMGWCARSSVRTHPHTRAGADTCWDAVPLSSPRPAVYTIGESCTACVWGRGHMPRTHLGGSGGVEGGGARSRVPHPPTHQGLERAHAARQHPYSAHALPPKYTVECRTACGWGRGRMVGTYQSGSVSGWPGGSPAAQSSPTHPGPEWANTGR